MPSLPNYNDIFHGNRTKMFTNCLEEKKRPGTVKAILRKKNGARGIRLPDFTIHYKATVTKTVWYWHQNRNTDHGITIEILEIKPVTYINNLRYADNTTLNSRKWRGTKEPPDESERGECKADLNLKKKKKNNKKHSFKKTKIMACSSITSWQIEGGKVKAVTDFLFLGSKMTTDSDCSHEIKRCLVLGRKAVTNLVQFSHSFMSNSLRPHEPQHTRPPCLSPTPGVYPNSCPLSQWCHPAISSSVIPFSSCLQSFPTWGSFPMSQLFASGGQNIGGEYVASTT